MPLDAIAVRRADRKKRKVFERPSLPRPAAAFPWSRSYPWPACPVTSSVKERAAGCRRPLTLNLAGDDWAQGEDIQVSPASLRRKIVSRSSRVRFSSAMRFHSAVIH